MIFAFNNKVFSEELRRHFSKIWLLITCVVGLVLCFLAGAILSYALQSYGSVWTATSIAKIETWSRFFFSLAAIFTTALCLWCIFSIVMSALVALHSSRLEEPLKEEIIDTEVENTMQTEIQTQEETTCNVDQKNDIKISIKASLLRPLFSSSFSDEKFVLFVEKIKEKQSLYKKRDYGKIAHLVMFKSKYCSDDDQYKRVGGGNRVPNFGPYVDAFYQALGIKPSSTNLGYYEDAQQTVFDDFKDILDLK